VTFARYLADHGVDPHAPVDTLTARFIKYAGGEDPDTLFAALIAQFALVNLGITAERGTEVDVVYRGNGGQVLGCEILAWDDTVDEARVAALVAFSNAQDALAAGVLTQRRTGTVEGVPLRPLAVEALRVGLRG